MPEISIIIPVYNAEQYITRCLESVIAQEDCDWEAIIVDDHGHDDSIRIAKEYISSTTKKDCFRFIETSMNSGPGCARNAGLDAAKGKYVAFLDADDWVRKNMYHTLVDRAEKNNADICWCDAISEGKILSNPTATDGETTELSKKAFLLTYVAYLWTNIYRREFLEKNKIRFYAFNSSEDSCFIALTTMMAQRVASIHEPLYHYCINAESVTTVKNPNRCFVKIDAFRHLLNDARERGLYETFSKELEYLFIKKGFLMACIDYRRNSQFTKRSVLKQLRARLIDTLPDYKQNVYFAGNRKLRLLNMLIP